MEEKDIKDEVLNNIDFGKVLEHGKKCHLSVKSKMEEMQIASDLMDLVIGSVEDNGEVDVTKGMYRCKAEKEDGVIISLLLECSDHITGYQYCQ